MCEIPNDMNRCHSMHQNHRFHHRNIMHCCRNFLTKEEKIKHLEEYKKWLEQEAKGVQEKIDEINKAS